MNLNSIYIALLFSFLWGCVPEKEKNARLIIHVKEQDDYLLPHSDNSINEKNLSRYIRERTPERVPPKKCSIKLEGKMFYNNTRDDGVFYINDLKPGGYSIERLYSERFYSFNSFSWSYYLDGGKDELDKEMSQNDYSFDLAPGEERIINIVMRPKGTKKSDIVKTVEVKDIQHDKVSIVGELTYLSAGTTADVGFVINKKNAFYTKKNTLGTFEAFITNLEPEKEYIAHAYVNASHRVSYGEKIKFTTKKEPFPISSSLVAYYTFDNANCNDYWGNIDYHGILQGVGEPPTFVTNTPNGNGKAMKCTGEKFFKLIKKPISINHRKITDHTVSVWVNTKNSTGELYTEEGGYCGGNAPSIALILSSNKINKFNLNYTDILFDGNWHHIVFIFDQDFCSLYIDGEFMERIKHDMCYQGSNVNAIGKNYVGLMDNLRLYTRKLSDTEIRKLYQSKM